MVSKARVTFANTTKEINLKKCKTAADIRRQVFEKFRISGASGPSFILKCVDPITETESPLDDTILGNIQSDEICMTVSYENDEIDETQTKSNNDDKQCSNYGNFVEKDASRTICANIQQTPLLTPSRREQLVRRYGKDAMKNISGDAFRVEFPLEQCTKEDLMSLFDKYLIVDSMPMPVKQLIKEKYLALLYNEHYQTELSTTITEQGRMLSKEILMMVNIRSWTQNNHLICVIAYGELELPHQFMFGSSPSKQYESVLQNFCIEASKED